MTFVPQRTWFPPRCTCVSHEHGHVVPCFRARSHDSDRNYCLHCENGTTCTKDFRIAESKEEGKKFCYVYVENHQAFLHCNACDGEFWVDAVGEENLDYDSAENVLKPMCEHCGHD